MSDIALCCFLAIVCLLGLWRTGLEVPPNHIERAGTGTIVLEGRIDEAPEIADTAIAYIIGDLTLSGSVLHGRAQVRDQRMWPRYSYGERVRLSGELKIAGYEGYDRSLRTKNIQATLFGPRIENLSSAPLSPFGILITVRETIEGRIRQLFPEPEASLAVGLLTGTRASFPEALTQALRTSGLTHITAVSGSNVAIVLTLLESLLFWVPRRLRLLPLVGGIALFGLFTGASASVVRACIMGSLGVLALHAGRMSQARRTILWTAGLMLLWNPQLLTGDLGFQLSFLSVLGILEISPHLEHILRRIPTMLALRENVALTLSSQIAAAPWIAYALGNLSLVALPANLLAGPLIPWAMLLGALATILSPLGIGLPIAFIANIPLRLIIGIAEGAASLPFAALNDLTTPLWLILLYYALLIAVLSYAGYRKPRATRDAGSPVQDQAPLRIMQSKESFPAP